MAIHQPDMTDSPYFSNQFLHAGRMPEFLFQNRIAEWQRLFQSWVITAAVGEIILWETLTFCCVFELQCFRLLLPKVRWCQKTPSI